LVHSNMQVLRQGAVNAELTIIAPVFPSYGR
jgi:hypothetical protein